MGLGRTETRRLSSPSPPSFSPSRCLSDSPPLLCLTNSLTHSLTPHPSLPPSLPLSVSPSPLSLSLSFPASPYPPPSTHSLLSLSPFLSRSPCLDSSNFRFLLLTLTVCMLLTVTGTDCVPMDRAPNFFPLPPPPRLNSTLTVLTYFVSSQVHTDKSMVASERYTIRTTAPNLK